MADSIEEVIKVLKSHEDGIEYIILPDSHNINDVVKVISYKKFLYEDLVKGFSPESINLLNKLFNLYEGLENDVKSNPKDLLIDLGFIHFKTLKTIEPLEYYKYDEEKLLGSFVCKKELMCQLLKGDYDYFNDDLYNTKWFNVKKCYEVGFYIKDVDEYQIGE
jgi:hypothetical protein